MAFSELCYRFLTAVHEENGEELWRIVVSSPTIFSELRRERGFPLCFALKRNSLQIVELLLQLGCDPDENDSSTALVHAVAKNRRDQARLLLRYGADPNLGSPLCNIVYQSVADPVEMARLLIEFGADPKLPFDSYLHGKKTVLELAEERGMTELAKFLKDIPAS